MTIDSVKMEGSALDIRLRYLTRVVEVLEEQSDRLDRGRPIRHSLDQQAAGYVRLSIRQCQSALGDRKRRTEYSALSKMQAQIETQCAALESFDEFVNPRRPLQHTRQGESLIALCASTRLYIKEVSGRRLLEPLPADPLFDDATDPAYQVLRVHLLNRVRHIQTGRSAIAYLPLMPLLESLSVAGSGVTLSLGHLRNAGAAACAANRQLLDALHPARAPVSVTEAVSTWIQSYERNITGTREALSTDLQESLEMLHPYLDQFRYSARRTRRLIAGFMGSPQRPRRMTDRLTLPVPSKALWRVGRQR